MNTRTTEQAAARWLTDFHTFGDPVLRNARDVVHRYVSDLSPEGRPHWLCLLGSVGTGKSHLARGILSNARGLWTFGEDPKLGTTLRREMLWSDWRKVAKGIMAGQHDFSEALARAWLAVIDDVGVSYDKSGYLADQLDSILCDRLGKWTVITSNLSFADVREKLDSRIASRMIRGGSVICEMSTVDYNLRTNIALTHLYLESPS